MPQWKKNLYVLWFGCFVAQVSFSLVTPFMPLFLQDDLKVTHGIETWSGLMYSVSFLTSAIMSPIWGSLADRYGRKIMFVRSGIMMGIINMLQSFVTTPEQLLALRALNGVFSGFIPSATALLATNTPEDNLGPSLGMLQTGNAAGQIMGPLVGGIAAQLLGARRTFFFAGLVLFVATLISVLGVKETRLKLADSRMHILNDIREALANTQLRIIMFSVVFIYGAQTVLAPVITLQVAALGQSDNTSVMAGVVYSMVGIATILGAPFWARRGERIGYKRVLVIGLVSAAIFNIPQAFTKSIFTFGALRFATGLSLAGISLSLNAITAKSVSKEFRGRAFGIFNSFGQMGSVVGPLAGGIAGTTAGLSSTFLIAAATLFFCAIGAQRFLPKEEPLRTSA
jgi:MFS transporter, DHA1 family, multidrug resistance protein